jgi:hypothetical protein
MDWSSAKKSLENMMHNKIVKPEMQRELRSRILSIESLVIDISDSIRSDKD